MRVKQYDSVLQTGERFSSVTFDTADVYVIDPAKKLFFEFDSFKTNARIISSGQLHNKKFGVLIENKAATEADSIFNGDLLRDTVVSGNKLLYFSSVEKNIRNADSAITHIFFLKAPNFISIHDIPKRAVKDGSFNMVGFNIHLIEQNVSVSNELEEFRTLNRFEEKICTGMINTMLASKKEH